MSRGGPPGAIARRVAKRIGAAMSSSFDDLHAIGVDETGYRKGHTYITVVVDHERRRVIWAHDGYGRGVFDHFSNSSPSNGASPTSSVSSCSVVAASISDCPNQKFQLTKTTEVSNFSSKVWLLLNATHWSCLLFRISKSLRALLSHIAIVSSQICLIDFRYLFL